MKKALFLLLVLCVLALSACSAAPVASDAPASTATIPPQVDETPAASDASAAQALAAQLGCSSLSALIPSAQGGTALAQAIGAPLPAPLHLGFDFD